MRQEQFMLCGFRNKHVGSSACPLQCVLISTHTHIHTHIQTHDNTQTNTHTHALRLLDTSMMRMDWRHYFNRWQIYQRTRHTLQRCVHYVFTSQKGACSELWCSELWCSKLWCLKHSWGTINGHQCVRSNLSCLKLPSRNELTSKPRWQARLEPLCTLSPGVLKKQGCVCLYWQRTPRSLMKYWGALPLPQIISSIFCQASLY